MLLPSSYEEALWLMDHPDDRPILEAIDAACDYIARSPKLQSRLQWVRVTPNEAGSQITEERLAGLPLAWTKPDPSMTGKHQSLEFVFVMPTPRTLAIRTVYTDKDTGFDRSLVDTEYGSPAILHARCGISIFVDKFDIPSGIRHAMKHN